MRIDPQTEFQDAESCLRQADIELKSQRYESAAALFKQALELLRQTRTPGHADITFCLQNLCDAYAMSGDYQEGYDVAMQLLEIRTQQPGANNVDLISTKFKLAKMLEMLQQYPQAAQVYEDAMTTADSSLYEGHPLRGVIYVSYLEMLQKERSGDSEMMAILKSKAEKGREDLELGDKMLEGMHLRSFIGLVRIEKKPPPPPPPPEPVPGDEPSAVAVEEVSAKPSNKMIPMVAAVIVIAGIAGGAFFMMNKQEDKKAAQAKATVWVNKNFDGQTFESPSGQDKLVFAVGGNVDSVLDGVERHLPAVVLPPDTDLVSSSGNVAHTRFFRRVPSGMLEDNGRMLYASNAPQQAIMVRVKAIATAAQKYYEEHKEYPQTAKDLTDIDPAVADNPVSKAQDDLVFIDAGKNRDLSPGQTPEVAGDLEKGAMLPGEPDPAPGAVHCYTFSTGDKYVEGVKCVAFFIRPIGPDGKWLAGNSAGHAYCAVLMRGAEPNVAGMFTPKPAAANDASIQGIKVIADK